ncbi:MAG: tetratricopeptide repeat protein [Nitrososphaera sp.]|nr:tetratricopeptide repeat protein [Nitrososphaera sp.]
MLIDEPTLAAMLEQARSLVAANKHLHAVQLYRRIVEAAPTLEVVWIELAEAYAEMKQLDAAEHALLQARQYSKDKYEITFLLGNLNLKRQKYAEALSYYKVLQAEEKQLPPRMRTHVLFNSGLIAFHRNNFPLAEEYFRKVRELDQHFPKINESIGELLLRRGAVAEAVSVLQAGVKEDTYSWISHYLLGVAYMRLYDWRNAYEEFVTAIEMDPKEAATWQLCGEVLIALQQLDEAEQYLRKALELNPQLTDAVANFGALFLKRGDYERAREFFERALALDPKNHKALLGAAELNSKKFKV